VTHYLDTSALAKLAVTETESAALHEWLLQEDRRPTSSDLARTELLRAVRRFAPGQAVRAREVLDALTLVQVTTSTFDLAGRLVPSALRSLDAIHLAVAIGLGDDLDALVTYDVRLADAARANGVAVIAPG